MRNEKRVLVADDDQAIRQLLCTLIRREQIIADCVADGSEAIAKLEQTDYYVILLDLMMPKVDGFAVIEYLRTHPRQPKPIVFIISAYADQSFKRVDPRIVAGVLHKPFDVIGLGELVRHCVEGYEPELGRVDALSRYAALQQRDFSSRDEDNGHA